MSPMEEISESTVAATVIAAGQHLLKLEGYRLLKGMHGHGVSFSSCLFEAAGHTWNINCYPNGHRKDDAGFFSVYLAHRNPAASTAGSAAATVQAEVELALVRHRSSNKLLSSSEPPYSRRFTHTFIKGKTSWGFEKFISTAELERLGLVKDDDCLTIRCKITVVDRSARMICKCNDDLCKQHHKRPNKGLKKAFLRFFRSLFRG